MRAWRVVPVLALMIHSRIARPGRDGHQPLRGVERDPGDAATAAGQRAPPCCQHRQRGRPADGDEHYGLSSRQGTAASYGISPKAALLALTATLAAELADAPVIINAVDPSLTATWPGAETMGARPVTEQRARDQSLGRHPPRRRPPRQLLPRRPTTPLVAGAQNITVCEASAAQKQTATRAPIGG